NTVELAKGTTVRVHYSTNYCNAFWGPPQSSNTEPAVPAIRVKVFSGSSGALLLSQELTRSTEGNFSIDINRDHLREEGDPDSGKLQLWIVVAIKLSSADGQVREPGIWVLQSLFELIDNASGTSTGGVWKTTNFLTADPVR